MTKFHAVMLDETRCEFGVTIEALNHADAYNQLEEDYPESCVVQLESPDQSANRENATMQHIMRGGDWDEEGRPFFPHGDEYDDEGDYE